MELIGILVRRFAPFCLGIALTSKRSRNVWMGIALEVDESAYELRSTQFRPNEFANQICPKGSIVASLGATHTLELLLLDLRQSPLPVNRNYPGLSKAIFKPVGFGPIVTNPV